MLDRENNGTVSLESLWRMTGGSQIGNCIKSLGTQNRQRKRPNPEISDTSVTKNYMGPVKCPFRRACAVEWFGQISRLGSSVASIWYMATDFGRRFVTWVYYTTWAQSRDFRGRKTEISKSAYFALSSLLVVAKSTLNFFSSWSYHSCCFWTSLLPCWFEKQSAVK